MRQLKIALTAADTPGRHHAPECNFHWRGRVDLMRLADGDGGGLPGLRHRTSGPREVLRRMRRACHAGGERRRVQTGDRAFRRCVRSMDIAAAVGPERLREIMSDLFDRCSEVVQQYGGTLDKFTGDGAMAIFGAPVSLEDHAIRACLAALDVQKQVRDLAVDVQQRDGIDLALRVGLNSGEVIAGEVGSRGHSYTTIGDQGRPPKSCSGLAAAREAIDWLTAMPTGPGVVIYEIALLRLRALLARACGDELAYRQYVDRYRAMANQIGFEGHIAMAEAMT